MCFSGERPGLPVAHPACTRQAAGAADQRQRGGARHSTSPQRVRNKGSPTPPPPAARGTRPSSPGSSGHPALLPRPLRAGPAGSRPDAHRDGREPPRSRTPRKLLLTRRQRSGEALWEFRGPQDTPPLPVCSDVAPLWSWRASQMVSPWGAVQCLLRGNLRVSGRSWQGTQILHLNTISTHSNAWPGNTVSLPTPPSRGHQTGPLTLRDGPQVLESDASQGEAQDLGFRCFIRSGLHKPNSRATCRDLPTHGEQRALRRRSPRGVHLLT